MLLLTVSLYLQIHCLRHVPSAAIHIPKVERLLVPFVLCYYQYKNANVKSSKVPVDIIQKKQIQPSKEKVGKLKILSFFSLVSL